MSAEHESRDRRKLFDWKFVTTLVSLTIVIIGNLLYNERRITQVETISTDNRHQLREEMKGYERVFQAIMAQTTDLATIKQQLIDLNRRVAQLER